MVLVIVTKILWATSLAALLLSAATDLKQRIIPNELVVVIALSGLLTGLAMRPGQIGVSLVVAALVFLTLGFLCRYGVLGGGDVKLTAAVTLLVPPGGIGDLLIKIALAGGLLSCFYLGASYFVRNALAGSCEPAGEGGSFAGGPEVARVRVTSRKEAPYAVAILGGVIWYVASESFPCSAMSCLF